MKSYCISIWACFLSLTGGIAQTDTFEIMRSVFPATGIYWQDPATGLSLSYSVGETVIETATSLFGTLVFTQGFQQPDDDKIVGIDDLSVRLDYLIYPNPTTGPITIELTSEEPLILQLAVYDLIGQETPVPRQEVRIMGKYATQMDLTSLADGVYLLAIVNEKKRVIQTFRIEKYY